MALTSAKRLLPALLATSLLAGCGWYSRTYQAQEAKRLGRSLPEATAKAEPQGSVVQAGTPAEAAPAPVAPAPDPQAEKAKVHQREESARVRAEREDLARRSESVEAEAMRVWRLDQGQIDDLLQGERGEGSMIGLFMISNDIDLSFARLAYQRSEHADVRAFAKRLITDHTQMIASSRALLTERDDVVPVETMLTRALRDRAATQRDALVALDGHAFDVAYAAMELDYHKELLAMIDDVLLPRGGDGELHEIISAMRPVILGHMAHVEQLQAAIGKR